MSVIRLSARGDREFDKILREMTLFNPARIARKTLNRLRLMNIICTCHTKASATCNPRNTPALPAYSKHNPDPAHSAIQSVPCSYVAYHNVLSKLRGQ